MPRRSKTGANVNEPGKWQETPLHAAAIYGHTDTARLLLEKRADVNARDKLQRAPLHSAALNGHTDLTRLLIEEGAEINAKDNVSRTALDCAVKSGQTDMVALFEDAARKQATHAGRVKQGRDKDDQERSR